MCKGGVGEAESGGGQFGGIGAGTGEQGFIGNLAKSQAEREGGNMEKRRPVQLCGEEAGELRIHYWIRSGDVDRPGQGTGFDEEKDGGQGVVERDPAHELTAAAKPAPESKPEDRQETGKGASRSWAEDDAEAQLHDPDAGINGRLRRGFPVPAEIGQKAGARWRGLVKELVAAIAVDADSRGDQQHLGRMAECGKRCGEDASGGDSALKQNALVFGGPSMGSDVCAGKMNGGDEAFETLGVRDGWSRGRIPLELIGNGRSRAHQLENGKISGSEGFLEGRAEHSGRTGEQKSRR